MKTKIMIVDDHQIVIDGLRALLKEEQGIEISGQALNAEECIHKLKTKEISPDLLLMDIEMTEMNGIDATKIISKEFPNIKVLMLTMWKNPKQIREAFKAGARGYIHKDAGKEELIDGIIQVAEEKDKFYSKDIIKVMMNDIAGDESASKYKSPKSGLNLTSREKEILDLTSQGYLNKQIADELFLSEHTVKAHRKNILEKAKSVGINTTNELIRFAVEKGII